MGHVTCLGDTLDDALATAPGSVTRSLRFPDAGELYGVRRAPGD